jgi:4-hydroxy-2-oxoheptanedioate aldolase
MALTWPRPALGAWCSLPVPHTVEVAAAAGYDYVSVDMQHGLIDRTTLIPMLMGFRGTSVVPVVRVPANDAAAICFALDAGARAVIVPMVESARDAEAAARACRYAPNGIRSFGPLRASHFLGRDPAVHNASVACFVMIESRRGVDAADEICATPGIDGIYIGPADLAVSLGVALGDVDSSTAHREAADHVQATARAREVLVGYHGISGQQAAALVERGFDFVTVTTELAVMARGLAVELSAARATPASR